MCSKGVVSLQVLIDEKKGRVEEEWPIRMPQPSNKGARNGRRLGEGGSTL